jgi:hypothetical protein
MNGTSKVAYSNIDIDLDGSLNASGPGWNGPQDQALLVLITHVHSRGVWYGQTVNFALRSTGSPPEGQRLPPNHRLHDERLDHVATHDQPQFECGITRRQYRQISRTRNRTQ